MKRSKINVATLTMNPVLDKSTTAKLVVPEKKNRCGPPTYEPGGGGINVSRAIKKLECESLAIFLAGGDNGRKIEELLKKEEVKYLAIDSGCNTRENLMIYDEKTGNQFRFVMPGPEIKEKYWQKVLETLEKMSPHPHYLVASGSLPSGVPDDFYARVATYAKNNEVRLVLDTSGPSMQMALDVGVHLLKPNLREIADMLDKENLTGMELEEAAKEILNKKNCNILVVSLGPKGAMMARQSDVVEYIVPPAMPVVSTVGAGDSMVAGIIVGCTRGFWPDQAIRYGVAAGTAAAMTPGSELCTKEDTERIFQWLTDRNGGATN